MKPNTAQLPLKLGFTLILLGYFLVWLPHQAVGLSFIGLEMGEWTKFLPGIQQDQYVLDRVLFYLPPISLALMLIIWTLDWPNRRWKTWLMRIVAVVISLLAFPALESFVEEAADQWLARIVLILIVVASALLSSLAKYLAPRTRLLLQNAAYVALGVLGALLPMWTFLILIPEISSLFGREVGPGPGLWINTLGHLLVAGVGGAALYRLLEDKKSESLAA